MRRPQREPTFSYGIGTTAIARHQRIGDTRHLQYRGRTRQTPRPTTKLANTDTLTRIWAWGQRNDPACKKYRQSAGESKSSVQVGRIYQDDNKLLYRRTGRRDDQIVVPHEMRSAFRKEIHSRKRQVGHFGDLRPHLREGRFGVEGEGDIGFVRHLGRRTSYERVAHLWWWPTMRKDIKDWRNDCDLCNGTFHLPATDETSPAIDIREQVTRAPDRRMRNTGHATAVVDATVARRRELCAWCHDEASGFCPNHSSIRTYYCGIQCQTAHWPSHHRDGHCTELRRREDVDD